MTDETLIRVPAAFFRDHDSRDCEPVIFRGGRPRPRTMPTVRDWVSECITLKKGCPGAKPEGFTLWLLDLLNGEPHDEFVDMFPGSGMVTDAVERWRRSPRLPLQYA